MRRKPTQLKVLEGNLRRDRVNPQEPTPPKASGLRARRGLPPSVRRAYAALVALLEPMGVLTVSDPVMLELTAWALAEYERAARVVARNGMNVPHDQRGGLDHASDAAGGRDRATSPPRGIWC